MFIDVLVRNETAIMAVLGTVLAIDIIALLMNAVPLIMAAF